MAALISMVISATNQTNAAFGSAQQNVTALGTATMQTTARMDVLSDRIGFQQRRLGLLERQIKETTDAHGADSIQVERQRIRYDELTQTIVRNERALDRLHREQREGAAMAGGPAGAGGGLGGLGGLAALRGGAGGLIAVETIRRTTEFYGESLKLANSFTDVDTAVRSLAGTQDLYNQVMRDAETNQRRYGGSLQAQLEGMTALIPLVRTTNAEFETLNLTQQLLAARTPSQGTGGAAYAIQELLSGDTAEAGLSLRDRFNLPPAQVNDLIARTQGNQQARLEGLTGLLAEQGTTEATLQAQDTNAGAPSRRLSAAWSNFRLREGRVAQEFANPVLNMVAGGLEALTASPSFAQMASGQSGGGPTVINNITVQGSVITEKQLADTTRRVNTQTAERNGVRRPLGSSR